MKFKNYKINQIWEGSQACLYTHDAYVKLAEFEYQLVEYMRYSSLTLEEKIEGYKVLATINTAQIRVLELKLNVDLNGNGIIGE